MLSYALAILSGLFLFLIHPRFEWTFLAPIALTPLLLALRTETRWKHRALLGFTTGIVHWAGMCYWIHFVMSVHGGLGDLGGAAVFVLFCAGCALGTAAFAAIAGPMLRSIFSIPAVAALWVVNEWVPAPYGFTWLGLGDAALNSPLARLAPWTGVYGMTFVIATASVALLDWKRAWRLAGWLLIFVLPPLPDADKPTREAVVVQPNIPTDKQWAIDEITNLARRLEILSVEESRRPPRPALLVWPEVPAPFYFDSDVNFRELAASTARLAGVPFLFGTVGFTDKRASLNSAILLTPGGEVADRYSKIELVPFGEYVPAPFESVVPRITSEVSDFVPGDRLTNFQLDGHKTSVFICYESAFPGLVRRFDGELLLNLSNDGYFGKHAAREQHLALVRMRAIENARWILRATNDGITASIDPAGRIARELPPYRELVARLPFEYRATDTPYHRWGDWFVSVCSAICLVSYAGSRVRRHP